MCTNPNWLWGMLISGNETSLIGVNPSEALALQRALIKCLYSSGSTAETSGALNNKEEKRKVRVRVFTVYLLNKKWL